MQGSIIQDIMDAEILFESDEAECACSREAEIMEAEIALIEKRITEGRKEYHDMLVQNLKKDHEIQELEERIGSCTKYSSSEKYFSDDSMDELRSIGMTEMEDSKFILSAIRGLYKSRLEVLKNKNLSGRSKLQSKEPVTPEKMDILRNLLLERIDNVENPKRENNLKKMVKTAIETINEKHD